MILRIFSALFILFPVNSTGLIRPHGEQLTDLSASGSSLGSTANFENHRISDFFVGVNNTDIFAHVGTTAHFDCLVARPNLDEHGPILWLRDDPFELISIGGERHTLDQRYWAGSPDYNDSSKRYYNWGLAIRRVKLEDSGTFKCQTSSHPPRFMRTTLHTIEARAVIEGPSEKYIKAGSRLKLICIFHNLTEPPQTVFWYLDDRMIIYDSTVKVERINLRPDLNENSASKPGLFSTMGTVLTVDRVSSEQHDGNYTCAPSTVTQASVRVHIIDEGKMPPAPVYGDAHSSSSGAESQTLFSSVFLIMIKTLMIMISRTFY